MKKLISLTQDVLYAGDGIYDESKVTIFTTPSDMIKESWTIESRGLCIYTSRCDVTGETRYEFSNEFIQERLPLNDGERLFANRGVKYYGDFMVIDYSHLNAPFEEFSRITNAVKIVF